jgi:GNAT superfamily N-acetyltransferase
VDAKQRSHDASCVSFASMSSKSAGGASRKKEPPRRFSHPIDVAMSFHVRPLDRDRQDEIELVARRMRETLVEVLGAERGGAMYTHEWLVNRVRWHLDPAQITGEVLVIEDERGVIAGHAIVRIDQDGDGRPIGLLSTIFVDPARRRRGFAGELIRHAEGWMRARGMTIAVTYTDRGNEKLQTLFTARGYSMSPMPEDFVRLAKELV